MGSFHPTLDEIVIVLYQGHFTNDFNVQVQKCVLGMDESLSFRVK